MNSPLRPALVGKKVDMNWFGLGSAALLVKPESTLIGRTEPMAVDPMHAVNGRSIKEPFPEGFQTIYLAMGCFWGAERKFWTLEGVWVTAVGYTGGETPNPTYREVCSDQTNHAEAVLVVWDPAIVSLEKILSTFWESHNPTQGMRQGNDVGTSYRSGIWYTSPKQEATVLASRDAYQELLLESGLGQITTEIATAGKFYYAETNHQQYLYKNPNGYCGMGGTGVSCPIGLIKS